MRKSREIESFEDVVTWIMDNDKIDDEFRLFQLKLVTCLSKLPIEKLEEIRTKLEYCKPLRVIAGGKK